MTRPYFLWGLETMFSIIESKCGKNNRRRIIAVDSGKFVQTNYHSRLAKLNDGDSMLWERWADFCISPREKFAPCLFAE